MNEEEVIEEPEAVEDIEEPEAVEEEDEQLYQVVAHFTRHAEPIRLLTKAEATEDIFRLLESTPVNFVAIWREE